MAGFIRGIDLEDHEKTISKIGIGNKVKVVFADERQGSILDFWYEPVG